MSEKRRDAFFEEFPWLSKYVKLKHRKYIRSIKVSRADKDLLGRTALSEFIDKGEDSYYIFEQLVLLDENGDILKRELPSEDFSIWRPCTWRRHRFIVGRVTEPHTVAECIVSLGSESERIAFIFSVFCNNLVIYKPPKKFNIQTLLEEVEEDKRREAEEEKKKEAEIFDAQKQSIRKEWESLD
ncbi:MAG: hypothetical protein WCV59_02765 [Parcubacteria group bacterium]|jgi:hypothetical protein